MRWYISLCLPLTKKGWPKPRELVTPDEGFEWVDVWKVDISENTNSEGWTFAFNWEYGFGPQESLIQSFVRRRVWV